MSHKIFNYTFLANETHAYPDGNISVIDDLYSETNEIFWIRVINVSLPFGVTTVNDSGTASIIILDNESE